MTLTDVYARPWLVKDELAALGHSQRDLARATGIAPSTLCRIMANPPARRITTAQAEALADYLARWC